MILLDTCALIWYTEDYNQLSKKAKKACRQIPVSGAVISSISIWEIGIKIKNRKIDIGTSIDDFVFRLRELNTIEMIPVDEKIWLENLALDWEHKDPADRTIVATAKLKDIPIVTSDTNIINFYPKTIW